jgi:multiple sugar transport system permease protein
MKPLPRGKSLTILFLLPSIALLAVFNLAPFLYAVWLSFTNLNLRLPSGSGKFIGLDNYRHLLDSGEFANSLLLTILFVIVVVSLEFLIGLTLALLLNRDFMGKRFVIPLVSVPMMIAPICVGLMWRIALNYEFGVTTWLMDVLGVGFGDALLGSKATALPTLMAIDIWQWTPFMFLIMIAGLHGLPKEPYEAARVDGASRVQMFFRLTLPLLKPLIIIALLLRVIDAFRTFDQVLILTGGGPGNNTELLSMFAYRINFNIWDLGYGSSVILVIFYIILVIIALFYNSFQKGTS